MKLERRRKRARERVRERERNGRARAKERDNPRETPEDAKVRDGTRISQAKKNERTWRVYDLYCALARTGGNW